MEPEADLTEPPSEATVALRGRRADPRVESEESQGEQAAEASPVPPVLAPRSPIEPPVAREEARRARVPAPQVEALAVSPEVAALQQQVAKLKGELERMTETLRASASVEAGRVESVREAEERAKAAESKASTLAEALAAVEKARDEARLAGDAERLAQREAIARLEERAATPVKVANEGPAPSAGGHPLSPISQKGAAPRPPNYYGAKTVTVVQAPESTGGETRRGLLLAAKIVAALIVVAAVYQNRDVFQRAVAPVVDMPKNTGAREEIARIVDAIEKDQSARGLPLPADFSDYLRKSADPGASDASKDPWGTPYRLDIDPKGYSVRSAGADREYGTEDDIVERQVRVARR